MGKRHKDMPNFGAVDVSEPGKVSLFSAVLFIF
jgi:hypothetical protein